MELRAWNGGFMREAGRWVRWAGKELAKRMRRPSSSVRSLAHCARKAAA